MSNAIIVGNGTSRLSISLLQLHGTAPIYGCNALYRDYAPSYLIPDYLVAIDNGIIREIQQSDFPKDRLIIPPPNEQWEPADCNPMRPRSNAGVNAILEAIKHGATNLILLGFDFVIMDRIQSVSNVYDGTINYGLDTRATLHDNVGRVHYLNYVARKNLDKSFFLCYPNTSVDLHRLTENNIHVISFENLLANIGK